MIGEYRQMVMYIVPVRMLPRNRAASTLAPRAGGVDGKMVMYSPFRFARKRAASTLAPRAEEGEWENGKGETKTRTEPERLKREPERFNTVNLHANTQTREVSGFCCLRTTATTPVPTVCIV